MKNSIAAKFLGFMLVGLIACQKDDDLTVNSLAELEEKLEHEVNQNDFPSISYCVVKNDSVLYSGAMGYADEDANRLATHETRYLVASISKTITAVAAMQLVEQNLIGLDDDINQYLPFSVRNPSFPNDAITLRMLLAHRSSISDAFQETFTLDCYGIDCSMSLEQYFNAVFVSSGQYFSADISGNRPATAEDYSNLGSTRSQVTS